MSHQCYVFKCFHNLGLEYCYGTLVPLDLNTKLPFNMGVPLVDPTYYHITMGKFLHFKNILFLDIAFVVGFDSWFITTPQHPHIDVAPHIFCYLKSHPSLVIHYKGVVGKLIRHLSCSNSDFVGDVEGQRFTLGFVFSLGSGPISWSCKLAN